MNANRGPTLVEFLSTPIEEVARVAPATMIYGVGGTRRSAVMAGISSESDEYMRWSRERMIECLDILFRHGVHHIFTPGLLPSNFNEVGRYRERLIEWVDWGLAGPEALADYERLGWRVRLIGAEGVPELNVTTERLRQATPQQRGHTLWWHVTADAELPWRSLLAAVHESQARTREEAIRAFYGEDVPLATLFLSVGRPLVSPALLPPLLLGLVECYWAQKPGFSLTEREWRSILYDFAYLRSTWRQDKSGRAEQALTYREVWEQAPTIGLGQRVGPHWYPAPIAPPSFRNEEK